MPEIAVVIPTYNEVDNVRPLISRLRALSIDPRVIVVDDNSPDGTAAVVEEIAQEDARVQLIRRPAKLGLGTANKAGIALARELGAEYVATMDADFSHEPERLPALVAAAERVRGMSIGSRYVPGGISDYGSRRQILSRTANLLARLSIGGAAVRDATAGFRCFSPRALERICWDGITSEGYSFQVETVAMARMRGVAIAEVSIYFRDRVAGVSKISRREVVRGIATLARVLYRRIMGVRSPAPTLARASRRKSVAPRAAETLAGSMSS
jgi:dolichol-phosphate mannosyltransferase